MQGEGYDPPGIFTFSFMRSENAIDPFIDFMNDMGSILRERDLIDGEVRLPQRRLKIDYADYSNEHPSMKYASFWVDDGEHIAGVHPKTSLPFFMNASGSAIYKMCEGKMSIEEIFEEIKRIWPTVEDRMLLENLLSFFLLLEEIDILNINGGSLEGAAV